MLLYRTSLLVNSRYNNNMSKHIKYIIEGARQVLVIRPDDDYVRPMRAAFQRDSDTLRRDMGRIAKDMNKTIRKRDG